MNPAANLSNLPSYLQETAVGDLQTSYDRENAIKEAYEKAMAVSLHEGEDCLQPWAEIGRTLRDLWREKYRQVQSSFRTGTGSSSGRPLDPVLVAFASEARRPMEEAKQQEIEETLKNPTLPITRRGITEVLKRAIMRVPFDSTFPDELSWAHHVAFTLDPRVRDVLEDSAPSFLMYARREFLGQPDRGVDTDEKSPQ